MASTSSKTVIAAQPSPGNVLFPEIPPMRAPYLEYVYRLQAVMESGPRAGYDIKKPYGGSTTRSVMNVVGGLVKGPGINGIVVPSSGADWAEELYCDKVYYRLDARYAIQTDDGHFIYIKAKGLYRLGPNVPFDPTKPKPPHRSQDSLEYFSHLTFEAGEGPYNWMNSCVCVGVMQSFENQVCIDCWRLTNFPGVPVEELKLTKESSLPPRTLS
ncbi:hypothetical protein BKA65DRAFT_470827 [Rhexocercosporidium sp. MPI-PUGE-AT-0058]|nr:hypothetical protein BKA65DRAFT_470827 [Rhexocercosporidium sp. MPI-PUGE-AT-0058]